MNKDRRFNASFLLISILFYSNLMSSCGEGAEGEGDVLSWGGTGGNSVYRQQQAIVGGTDAARPYPFMVSLNDRYGHFCGGSIIHKDWVVTAAHCVAEGRLVMDPGDLTLVIGTSDLSRPNRGELLNVDRIVPHEDYDPRYSYNDIALLKLTQSTSYSAIRLPTREPSSGHDVKIIGWGALREGGRITDQLQEAIVPVVSNRLCDQSYGNIVTTHICAGFHAGGRDSCQGDSGGPLFNTGNRGYQLFGITSFGEGCARPDGRYGVYTRVSKFADWIADKTAINNPDPDPDPDPDPVRGQGTILSRNGDFSSNDTDLSINDTLYIKVWDSTVDPGRVRKAKYRVKVGNKSVAGKLENHGDGTFTAALSLKRLASGSAKVKIHLKDADRNRFEPKVYFTIRGRR